MVACTAVIGFPDVPPLADAGGRVEVDAGSPRDSGRRDATQGAHVDGRVVRHRQRVGGARG
jgi:hypothetical protein